MEDVNESNLGIVKIDKSDVPVLIQNQFDILNEYSANVKVAKDKAEEVIQLAVKSQKKGVHFFKMKNSIEDMQTNNVALSESNKINAELHEKSFEYQKKLSEIMQYLFQLGVSNIAASRCVVQELQMRLDNASEQEIDEMAKQEIYKVIQQIKAQEDFYIKIMDITGKVKEHESKIVNQENKNLGHDELIDQLINENKELRQKIIHKEKMFKKRFVFISFFAIFGLLVGAVALVLTLVL